MTRRSMQDTRLERTYGQLTWVVGSKAVSPPASVAKFARKGRRAKEFVTAGRRVAWMVTVYQATAPKLLDRALRLP